MLVHRFPSVADRRASVDSLMKRLLLALALLAPAANAQTIVWNKYDPMAVRTNRTADVALEAQTSGTVSGMRLDYANGGSLALTQNSPGHWVASVPAAKVLDGYAADDVNHNFVGFIRLLASDGSTHQFVQQLHPGPRRPRPIRHHPYPRRQRARDAAHPQSLSGRRIDADQCSRPRNSSTATTMTITTSCRSLFVEPSYPSNRYHFAVRNDVDGIGETKFNSAPSYGSAGKLQGITVYPVDFFFDAGETAFSHELGHQWVLFLKNSALAAGTALAAVDDGARRHGIQHPRQLRRRRFSVRRDRR